MPATYEPIATLTFNGTTSSGSLTSIPGTYTDLKLIFIATSTSQRVLIQINGTGGTNYSQTWITGNGSTATSTRTTNENVLDIVEIGTTPTFSEVDFFNYAGSTFKTCLISDSRDLNGSGYVRKSVGMWRQTSAITSIAISGGNSNNITGTATLYGILRA